MNEDTDYIDDIERRRNLNHGGCKGTCPNTDPWPNDDDNDGRY